MQDHHANRPKLYPHDYIVKAVFLPFVPDAVLPNHVTVFRMVFTPVVLWLLYSEYYVVGLPLFVLLALSDALDGTLARVRNKITPWGIFFDPVADKLLIGSVALLFAIKYFDPRLVFAAIIMDILPSIRWASTSFGGTIMRANMWGKIKMVLQCVSITLLLLGVTLHIPAFILAGQIVLGVAIAFSLVAVITYSL